jgi:hypothetical protein
MVYAKENNKIRLMNSMSENREKWTSQDHEVTGHLDFSQNTPYDNLCVADPTILKDYVCTIPLNLWKIVTEKGLSFIDTDTLEDGQALMGVATSKNVFWVSKGDIYVRDIALCGSTVFKGSINYCKKNDCAILSLTL